MKSFKICVMNAGDAFIVDERQGGMKSFKSVKALCDELPDIVEFEGSFESYLEYIRIRKEIA